MSTNQTDHRAEADYIMDQGATATEHLLAAIHDEQREQTDLLRGMFDALRGLAVESIPGEDVLPSEHPESCRCGECLSIENRPGDASGRIGWLDIDGPTYLAREVEGGWTDDDRMRAIWPREAFPSAEFTPILDPATQVIVNRDDLLTYLDASKGWVCAEDRLRAALDGQS